MNPQKIDNSTIRITKTVYEDIKIEDIQEQLKAVLNQKETVTRGYEEDMARYDAEIARIEATLAEFKKLGVEGKKEEIVEEVIEKPFVEEVPVESVVEESK